MKTNAAVGLLCFIIGLIMGLKNCNHVITIPKTVEVCDTAIITLPAQHDIIYLPSKKTVDSKPDSVPQKITHSDNSKDSIIKDYFTQRTYSRQWHDSLFTASIQDTVKYNWLQGSSGLKIDYRPEQKLITQTKTVTENNRKVYFGIMVSADKNSFHSLTPAVQYETKNGLEFLGGYDLLNNSVTGGFFLKLSLHKK